MNREDQRLEERISDILENIKEIDLIGAGGLDIYLEPSANPRLTAELALAIKPILIKYRNKLNISKDEQKLGF